MNRLAVKHVENTARLSEQIRIVLVRVGLLTGSESHETILS
jgi:hypothetical protein